VIEIRPATSADAGQLAKLRWEFRSSKSEPVETPSEFIARCAEWMQLALASNAWRAWAAVDRDAIVGQAWGYLVPKLPNPAFERERHLYISNVFVLPAARGGVGTRLLAAAIDFAKAEHVDRVILWSTERSRTMYARAGFTRTESLLELVLSD
jgi:GNAT superfamily N-acetyltransferase